jgi:crotonobetainyl-CoA:carnitine CoA-transferase CaiB-like acyl-CoA transferase
VGERPKDAAVAALAEAGVAVAVVNSVADITQDLHVKARQNLVTVTDAAGEQVLMQNVIPRLSNFPGAIRWTGEPLGASTQKVLARCGYSDAEIDDLAAKSVVKCSAG